MILVFFVVCGVLIAAQWKVFEKAGRPGWAVIVPIYNTYVLFEITSLPAWLAFFSIIPFLTLIPAIATFIANYRLAKLFGKSDGFAICNIFFGFITIPILGFGSAQFVGASPTSTQPVAPYDPTAPTPPAPALPITPSAVPTAQAPTVTPLAETPATSPTPPAAVEAAPPTDPTAPSSTPPASPSGPIPPAA